MKIEEVSKISKNGKTYYKLKIDGHNFTAFDSCDGFAQLEKEEVKAGYEAEVEYTETQGSYQGKPVTYKNIVKFNNVKVGEPTQNNGCSSSMKKEDWEAKDRRIVRMSCLSRAIEFFTMNYDSVAGGGVSEESVISLARKFEEQYIYKDVKSDEE